MSLPFQIGRSRAAEAPGRTEDATPIRGVLVPYEASPDGQAALHHALDIARKAKVALSVVSVVAKEPVVGCAQCQANAVFWNRERRSFAENDLTEAASLVGDAPRVDFALVEGRPAQAVGQAADRAGADVIVLPCKSRARFRRRVPYPVADHLRRAGRWTIVVAPAAAADRAGMPCVAAERPTDSAD